MARGASALVQRRGVRAALGVLVVLAAAGAVAVANVALLHVAGSPPGEVGSLSARLPDAAVPPPAASAPATTTSSAPTITRPVIAGDGDADGAGDGHAGDGRSSDD